MQAGDWGVIGCLVDASGGWCAGSGHARATPVKGSGAFGGLPNDWLRIGSGLASLAHVRPRYRCGRISNQSGQVRRSAARNGYGSGGDTVITVPVNICINGAATLIPTFIDVLCACMAALATNEPSNRIQHRQLPTASRRSRNWVATGTQALTPRSRPLHCRAVILQSTHARVHRADTEIMPLLF
jgi:hypothetical protein